MEGPLHNDSQSLSSCIPLKVCPSLSDKVVQLVGDAEALPFPPALDFVTARVGELDPIWNYLHVRVERTLPSAELVNIRRFGERGLWESFKCEKELTARRNGGSANSQLLFHGTENPQNITGTG